MKEKTRQKFLQQYPEFRCHLLLFSKSKIISSTTICCFGTYMHSVELLMTKLEAIKESAAMWRWLANNPAKSKEDYLGYINKSIPNPEDKKSPKSTCFLCEYLFRHPDNVATAPKFGSGINYQLCRTHCPVKPHFWFDVEKAEEVNGTSYVDEELKHPVCSFVSFGADTRNLDSLYIQWCDAGDALDIEMDEEAPNEDTISDIKWRISCIAGEIADRFESILSGGDPKGYLNNSVE